MLIIEDNDNGKFGTDLDNTDSISKSTLSGLAYCSKKFFTSYFSEVMENNTYNETTFHHTYAFSDTFSFKPMYALELPSLLFHSRYFTNNTETSQTESLYSCFSLEIFSIDSQMI